jgi:heptosyltransferase-1
MKVLIVKVSALGDVVHALPVLAWLKSADPGLEIDWLVEEGFAPLLEGHPLLRKIIRLDTRGWRKQGMSEAVRGSLGVIRQLRREHYDVVLDLQGNSKSGVFTRLCGAPMRFGFDGSQVREWPNLLATNHKVKIPAESHHISSRYLQIARAAFPGATEVPLCGPLPVLDDAAQTIAAMLDEYGLLRGEFLVAHYGTTWETKLWPLEYWLELVGKLTLDQGRQLVLTWGNDSEKHAAERMAEACQGRAVLWPRGTLQELVALLAAARLVIGADTGPVHIAAAVGTPTVSIFRVTDSRRNGPPGDEHIRLQAPMECSPCLRKSCERDSECGASISVASVIEAVVKLLKEHSS